MRTPHPGGAPQLVMFGGRWDETKAQAWARIEIDRVPMRIGLVTARSPQFDADAPSSARRVLVRVRAFSCNYRDKAFAHMLRQMPATRYMGLGSEFVGDVISAGRDVGELRPGDRVVPNHHYSGRTGPGAREGVVSSQASCAYHLLDADKLLVVPRAMSDDEAASLTIGAQTAYSMVRRLGTSPGMRILVTSGTSNTSLFLLAALRGRGVEVSVSTTSARNTERFLALGAHRVIVSDRRAGGAGVCEGIANAAERHGTFDGIVDPYFDLHLAAAVEAMTPGGTYVTCGYAGQNAHVTAAAGIDPGTVGRALQRALVRNMTIVMNCLGTTADLQCALDDHARGLLSPVIDSSFTEHDGVAPFLDRTFNNADRFGKVVFRYTS